MRHGFLFWAVLEPRGHDVRWHLAPGANQREAHAAYTDRATREHAGGVRSGDTRKLDPENRSRRRLMRVLF